MERCIVDVKQWMVTDRLLLKDEKTEFLLIGTPLRVRNRAWEQWK